MARRNQGNDDDYKIIDNDEQLGKYAESAKKYAKDAIDYLTDYADDRMERLSKNLQREYSDIAQAQEEVKRRQQSESRNTDNWKQKTLANILRETGRGGKFDTSKGAIGRAALQEASKLLQQAASIYITKPISSAISNMQSAYESHFTELAGRMGTNRHDTRMLMANAVSQLNSSYARTAIDANKELIPELQKVSTQGWKGQESISVALTNSIDHKIMPWLESASEAWTNIQFNLSDNQIKTLKAQQLMLQETRSGNRLLQTGVINQLTNEMQPLLTNIDYGVNADKITGQMSDMMKTFVDHGYTPQEAYAEAKSILDVYKNPTKGFESGNYLDVMRAEAAYNGGDTYDIARAGVWGVTEAAAAGMDSGFVGSGLGINTPTGVSRPEEFMRYRDTLNDLQRNGTTSSATAADYDKIASEVSQKVTATYEWDTSISNTMTSWLDDKTLGWPHGVELLQAVATTAKAILSAIVLKGIGKAVLNKTGLADQAAQSGRSVLRNISARGAIQRGSAAATKGLKIGEAAGEGMRSGGLIGGLTQGGAQMTGLSGGAATVAGGAALAGSALLVGGGISTAADTAKNWNTSSTSDKTAGVLSSAGMIGGGAALGAAALGIASGPVGWIGLAVGGLAAVGKAAYDAHKEMQNSTAGLIDQYDKNIETLRSEALNRRKLIDELKDQIKNASSDEEARKIAVNKGLVTADQAAQMKKEDIEDLVKQYDAATEAQSLAEQSSKERIKNEHASSNKENVNSFMDALRGMYDNSDSGNLLNAYKGTGRNNSKIDLSAEAQKNNNANKGTADLLSYIKNAAEQNESDDAKQLAADIAATFKTGSLSAGEMKSYLNKAQKTLTAEQIEGMSSSYSGVSLLEKSVNYTHPTVSTSNLHPEWYKPNDTSEADGLIAYLDKLKEEGVDRNAPAYQDKKKRLEELGYDVSSYAVGTPYIAHDQLAMVHQGEAILTKSDNTERIRSLLGLNNQQINATQISSQDIVNAISSQTDSIKQVLQQVIKTIQDNNKSGISSPFNNKWQNNASMSPTIANTRPV